MFVGADASPEGGRNENGNWVKKSLSAPGPGTVKTTANAIVDPIRTLRLPHCVAASNRPDACAALVERTNKHNDDYSMQRGTIKWFDTEKGFGFIEPEDGGEDVFLHVSNITGSTGGDDLHEGQSVAFETERTEKGLSALNASPVG